MALHVLQLGPYPPPEGGISRNMIAIREEVLASGGRCSIIATSRSSRVRDEPDVYHPRSVFALLRLLASLDFDVVHLHIGGRVSGRVLALAFAAAVFGRGKSILSLHSGAYPQTAKGMSAKPNSIRGFIFRRFARVIAVNEQLDDVLRRYGVRDDRIKIILPFSLRGPDEKIAIPAEFTAFYSKHSPVLLAVGGLENDYDPLFQIAAMKNVLAEYPDAGLMIVGDGSMRSEVEQAAASSGYADNIYIVGDVEHAVTLHLIEGADILLRTTLFDGDAISVREALFLGTPVIATDNGMRPEGVYLIGIGEKDSIVQGIRRSKDGKQHEIEQPDDGWDNIAKILSVYNEIAA